MILGIIEYACDQTSKEVSLVALCLTLAYVLRIRTAKYHHPTRFRKNLKNCLPGSKLRRELQVLSREGSKCLARFVSTWLIKELTTYFAWLARSGKVR
jgi:hypothetical protein